MGADGSNFNINSLPKTTPSRFAIELVRKLKGPTFLSEFSWDEEASRVTNRPVAPLDVIQAIKGGVLLLQLLELSLLW